MTKRPSTTRQHMAALIAWATAAAVIAAVAVTSSVATVNAQDNTEQPVDVAVTFYAADYNVSLEEAKRRLDRIQPIHQILAAIRQAESDRVAGWGIDHAGTFKGWVWLTGDQPPNTDTAGIANAHNDVEIRIGAVHTHNELRAAQDQLFDHIGPTGHTGASIPAEIERIVTYTGINMGANAIRIGIDPTLAVTKIPGGLTDPSPIAITDEAFQTKATEVTEQLQGKVSVAFVIEDGRGLGPAEETFGGGQQVSLTKGNNVGLCTAGFAARKNGRGAYGIITAGHCGDAGLTETTTTRMHGITLPFVTGYASANADAQFHSIPTGSSHILRDDFRCNPRYGEQWCDVTGDIARNNMERDYVCHFGISTRTTCGTVIDTSYEPRYRSRTSNACVSSGGDGTLCNAVFVKVKGGALKVCKGDSGGPVYRFGVAYGILKGGSNSTDCNATSKTMWFSAIREVEDFLGVQIITGGSVTIP